MPTSSPVTQSSIPSAVQLSLLAAIGAALVWLILTRTLAAYFAANSPSFALNLQPNEPRALVALAEAELDRLAATQTAVGEARAALNETDVDSFTALSRMAETTLKALAGEESEPAGPSANEPAKSADQAPVRAAIKSEDAATIRAWAKKAVDTSPLDADALGILARLAEVTDGESVASLMQTTARLSVRKSFAVFWLLQKAERESNHAEVARLADTLLRTRPRTLALIMPTLTAFAADEARRAELIRLLAENPPWRSAFFSGLNSHITDARTPLHVLTALNATPAPPTIDELKGYIGFLFKKNFHELAYYTWLQFQSPEELAKVGPINNPSFESPLSGLPFDWVLPRTGTAVTEVRSFGDGARGQSLVVEFAQGRALFSGVEQVLLAAPGSYVLKGRHRGRLIGTRGLTWKLSCVGLKQPLGQTPMILGDVPDWRDFSMTLTIPQEGCRAQTLRLDLDARSASEKLVTGTMWFDDILLSRIPE